MGTPFVVPTSGGIWPQALSVLLDSGIKGIVLLALAALIVLSMRRSSASARHLVWALALCGLLLLPIVSFIMPAWQLPILPRDIKPVPQSAPARSPRIETAPTASIVMIARPATTRPTRPIESAPTPMPVPESVQKPELPPAFWAIAIWLALAVLILAPLAGGTIAVAHMIRSGRPVAETFLMLVQRLSASIGLRRRVQVLASPPETMPMVIGLFRSTMLLPDCAREWPDEKRRAVLLHELAHIKRRDCLTHALARIAVALNWFNPLAWIAIRQMRIERERACDDLVLTAGERPSTYADHLLEIARTMQAGTLASAAAITMAKRSQLEGRLLAILDAGRNRGAIRKWVMIIGVVLLLLITIPLATLKFGEARVFSKMTPQEKREFDEWYTKKLTIPAEAIQPETFDPATIQAVQDFSNMSGRIQDLSSWPKQSDPNSEEFGRFISENRGQITEAAPILDLFKAIVARPDYTINTWNMAPEAKNASPIPTPDFVMIRRASRLLYLDSLMKLNDGQTDKAIESADALVGYAHMQPYSPMMNKMVAIAIMKYGLDAYQQIADRVTDPAVHKKIAENLTRHRDKMKYFPRDRIDPLVMDQIGMTAEARRLGVPANYDNKSGFEITIETMRINADYLERFALPKADDASERDKIQKQIDGYRKNLKSFAPSATGKWINPITAATLYSIAKPGFEKADENARDAFGKYDILTNSLAGVEKNSDTRPAASALQFRWVASDNERGWAELVRARESEADDRSISDMWLHKDVLLNESDVAFIKVSPDPVTKGFGLELQLSDNGREKLARLTKEGIGRRLAVVLNGEIISAPKITEPVTAGTLVVGGYWTQQESDKIARLIKIARSNLAARNPSVIKPETGTLQFRWVAKDADGGRAEQLASSDKQTSGSQALWVSKEILLDQHDIEDVNVLASTWESGDKSGTNYSLEVTFTEAGKEKFARVTGQGIGRELAIVANGHVLSHPKINESIPGGVCEIAGAFTQEEAESLTKAIRTATLNPDMRVVAPPVSDTDFEKANNLRGRTAADFPRIRIIRKQFEERAAKMKSMELRFEIAETYKKGSFFEDSSNGIKTGIFPDKDETVIATYRLLIQGGSRRLDNCTRIWSGDTHQFVNFRQTLFSDGIKFNSLEGGSNKRYQNDRDDTIDYVAIKPIVLAFMPELMDELANPIPDEKKPISVLRWETDEKSGKKLLVIGNTDYNSKKWHGTTQHEWLLDPERNMLPVITRALTPNGTPHHEARIEYKPNQTLGWFPYEIIVNFFEESSAPSRVYHTHIQEPILNRAINPAVFTAESPLNEPIYNELAARQTALTSAQLELKETEFGLANTLNPDTRVVAASMNKDTVTTATNEIIFSSGVRATLLGIGIPGKDPSRSAWAIDGAPLPRVPEEFAESLSSISPSDSQIAREFYVVIDRLPDDPAIGVNCKIGQPSNTASSSDAGQGRIRLGVAAGLAGDSKSAEIKVGIAAGPWRTAASSDGKHEGSTSYNFADKSFGVSFSQAFREGNSVKLIVSHDIRDLDTRLIAFDEQDRQYIPNRRTNVSASTVNQVTYQFRNIPDGVNLTKFEFQTREYEWRSFESVAVNISKRNELTNQKNNLSSQPLQRNIEALPTIDDIKKYFEKRKGNVRSFEIHFNELTTHYKGSVHDPTQKFKYYYEQDETYVATYRLLVQGDSARLDSMMNVFGARDERHPKVRVEPDTRITHRSNSRSWHKQRDGSIRQYDTNFDWKDYVVIAPLTAGFTPELIETLSGPPHFDKDVAVLRWEQDAQSGKKLLVIGNIDYSNGRRQGLTRKEWLLDPEREMLPVKARAMYADGRIGREDTIEYEKEQAAAGIYLVREVIQKNYRGNIETASNVTRIQVVKTTLNGEVDPAEFESKAPLEDPIYKDLKTRQKALDRQYKRTLAQ